ncbi:hypothetical protein ACS0TY_029753 [Phlomoides rotata]
MEEVGIGLIERQSSIENEPRTLNISQIQFAREAALYVVNTRSIEEALNIFTEGLEDGVVSSEGGCMRDNAGISNWNDDGACGDRINAIAAGIRDIVSAPF